jgi:hypothetical protein
MPCGVHMYICAYVHLCICTSVHTYVLYREIFYWENFVILLKIQHFGNFILWIASISVLFHLFTEFLGAIFDSLTC